MSLQPERTEKICLNCNQHLHGRYCHQCGQENIASQQTFWGFVKHFFDDFTHFDNKFFRTVRYITTKPGIMAREYSEGKRSRFVPPVRAYLFTSAAFFLFFFNLNSAADTGSDKDKRPLTKAERAVKLKRAQSRLERKPSDSDRIRAVALLSDSTRVITQASLDSLDISGGGIKFTYDDSTDLQVNGIKINSVDNYRKAQATLPVAKRDNWVERKMKERSLRLNQKYSGRGNEGIKKFADVFLHLVPYMLFLSLPLFAATLKLFYLNKRQLYYSDHAVFTLHFFIFVFITIFLIMVLGKLNEASGWRVFNWIIILLGFAIPVYFIVAMRRFYQQSWGKTIFKFFLFTFVWSFISAFLFILFLGVTFFQA